MRIIIGLALKPNTVLALLDVSTNKDSNNEVMYVIKGV